MNDINIEWGAITGHPFLWDIETGHTKIEGYKNMKTPTHKIKTKLQPGDLFRLRHENVISEFCGAGIHIKRKTEVCVSKQGDVVSVIGSGLFYRHIEMFCELHQQNHKPKTHIGYLNPSIEPPLEGRQYKTPKGQAFEVLAMGHLRLTLEFPTVDKWIIIKTIDTESIITLPVERWSTIFNILGLSSNDKKLH